MKLFLYKRRFHGLSLDMRVSARQTIKNTLTSNTNKPISYQWMYAHKQSAKRIKRREKRETPIRIWPTFNYLRTHTFHFRFACQCHAQHTDRTISILPTHDVPCVCLCVRPLVCVCSSLVSRNLNILFSNRPFLLLFCILSFRFFSVIPNKSPRKCHEKREETHSNLYTGVYLLY